jgi:hypothetical protein
MLNRSWLLLLVFVQALGCAPGPGSSSEGSQRAAQAFSSDNNATLATLLAGEVHLAGDGGLSAPQVAPLTREWAARGAR